MYAILSSEQWQVIGFNRDGTQQRLCSAHSENALLIKWGKLVTKSKTMGVHNMLPTYKAIRVWHVQSGFTGLDLVFTLRTAPLAEGPWALSI